MAEGLSDVDICKHGNSFSAFAILDITMLPEVQAGKWEMEGQRCQRPPALFGRSFALTMAEPRIEPEQGEVYNELGSQ
jgi:hypothetical protein